MIADTLSDAYHDILTERLDEIERLPVHIRVMLLDVLESMDAVRKRIDQYQNLGV